LWGTVAVTGAVNLASGGTASPNVTDFELDGGAKLTAGSLVAGGGSTLEAGDGSKVTVTGLTTLNGGFVAATNASIVQFGSLIGNTATSGYYGYGARIAVDDNSSLEVGTAGGAALGAVTIDKGATVAVSGTIDGNLVLKGALGVEAGASLQIDVGDPFGSASTISGTGTLTLSENSYLDLGVADSAAIAFAGPGASLILGAIPTGTITGFGATNSIQTGTLATGLSFKQVSAGVETLTLTKGAKTVGTLTLAGTYTGALFHLSVNAYGAGTITLQTVGSAPVQPTVIVGTAGNDSLIATANNQTLTGLGGTDSLSGSSFTGIDFKDSSADLNGSTISAYGLSDVIDLTDMNPASASVSLTPGSTITVPNYTVTPTVLTVTDGTRTAAIDFIVTGTVPAGYFSTASDGSAGTYVKYIAVNTDVYNFGSVLGGAFGVASNWQDTSIGATATQAPSYGNNLTIGGGASAFTDITGNGAAASLTTASDVLLLGTVVLGSKVTGVSGTLTQSGTLALDGGANLSLTGKAAIGGEVEIGGGSKLTAAGGLVFTGTGASVLAFGGSSAQFAFVNGTTAYSYGLTTYNSSVIGVDATSSLELGTTGGAKTGALTIDNGVTADLFGNINGNVVVNGTLAVAGTLLAIGSFGTVLPAITGAGTIDLFYGETLSIAGSDSAAIQFSSTALGNFYNYAAETLALGSSLPTGKIGGFAQGDMITVARSVTGLTYTASSGGGTLTLFNSSGTIGSLSLAGSYSANQFQLEAAPGGQSSAILFAPAPSTTGGSQVSSNSDTYSWNNASGGMWGNAGNWIDTATGQTPTTASGSGNAVMIQNSVTAFSEQIISGTGFAQSLTVSAPTIFTGNVSVSGLLFVNSSLPGSSYIGIANGGTISAGGLNLNSAFQVSGGGSLTVTGSSYSNVSGKFSVIGGSSIKIAGTSSVTLSTGVSIDATSRFELGSAGAAVAGSLTIDNGQSLTVGQSTMMSGLPPSIIAANLVVNGTLTAISGLIEGFGGTAGTVGGSGTIDVGSGMSYNASDVVLASADSATIAFNNYYNYGSMVPVAAGDTLLELRGPLPTGAITAFVAGDVIQVDQTITGVSFKQTTSTQGTLTLTNGAATVGTLTLAGSFATSLFHVDVAAASGYGTISVQSASAAAGTGSGSTGTDSYTWSGASGGVWSTASNWTDTTTSTTPTTVPGSGNAVTIAGSTAGSQTATTVGGNGAAASLAVSGDVLLTGTVAVAGRVSVSQASSIGELALDAKAKLTAGSAAITGTLQVGGGSSATVSGAAILTGGTVLALDGSTVQVGSLIANASNDVIAVDANSIFKIGSPTTAAAGTITQAAGATAALSGSIYGNIAAGGTIAVVGGGALFIDLTGTATTDPYGSAPTVSGAGLLSITEGSTLGLGAADSTAISFAGPNGTLVLAKLPTATISGFAVGDQIDLDQPVTAVSYKQVTSTTGTLTLSNGSATAGTLALSGSYASNAFHFDLAVSGTTAVISLQSLGIAVTQPSLIQGTAGADFLSATANGQTIAGSGGGGILNGATYTGLDFKDLTAGLNGSTIENFAASDVIDFTDLTFAKATETYSAGVLKVSDGTHAASLGLSFGVTPASGSFHIASDGSTGTKLTWS
jgi:hypothetical protein